jgi:hypothetical protein
VPLYLVIIGSLIVGVAISWILHVLDGVSTAIMVHRKNRQLQKTDTSLNALEKRIHDLEVENARLKGKAVDETFRTENPPVQEPKPSFFDRFRHNLRIG